MLTISMISNSSFENVSQSPPPLLAAVGLAPPSQWFLLQPAASLKLVYLVAVVFIVAGAVGNVLVCLAICLERALQNVTNYFLLSLSVADLLVCCVVMPFGLVAGLLDRWPLSSFWCNVYLTCDVLACTSSIWHMGFISVTRYLGIRRPLRHMTTSSGAGRAAARAALVWLLSLAISSYVTLLGIQDVDNIMPNSNVCAINNRGFFVVGSSLSFFIPMSIMAVTYVLTALLLHNKRSDIATKSRRVCKTVRRNVRSDVTREEYAQHQERAIAADTSKSQPDESLTDDRADDERQPWNSSCFDEGADNRRTTMVRSCSTMTDVVNMSFSTSRDAIGAHTAGNNSNLHTPTSNIDDSYVMYAKNAEGTRTYRRERKKRMIYKNVARLRQMRLDLSLASSIDSSARQLDQDSANECRAAPVTSCSNQHPHLPHHQLPHHQYRQKQMCNSTSTTSLSAECKASKVLGLVFATFVACWLPFFTMITIRGLFGTVKINSNVEALLQWLGYLSSTINPVIYTSVNRTFRLAFTRLLKCHCAEVRGRGNVSTRSVELACYPRADRPVRAKASLSTPHSSLQQT